MTDNEIKREQPSFEVRAESLKKRTKEFFSTYENPNGSEDRLEICLIREGYRAVLMAEEEINRQKAEIEALIAGQETLQKYRDEEINRLEIELKAMRGAANSYKAEVERLTAFKSYFDELYGKGLDIANWHKNGDLEPFDSFYNSALEEMAGDAE